MAFDIIQYVDKFFEQGNPELKCKWEEIFTKMAVHTRMHKPTDLMLQRRPNEDPEIHQYRLDTYEPITYGSMNKAFDSLNRLFSNVNYKIVADDKTQAYLLGRNFCGQTFRQFMQVESLKRTIEDPNGVLVWLPGGPGMEDNAMEVRPYPELVYSYQIHDIQTEVFSYLSNETVDITVGGTHVNGQVYYIFTKDTFYKWKQISTDGSLRFKLETGYVHNFGMIPGIVFGGDKNADGFYFSFFQSYVAFGNEAIRQFSDWVAVMVTSIFPYVEEFYLDCELHLNERLDTEIQPGDEKYSSAEPKLKPMARTPYGKRIRRVATGDETLGEKVLPADVPSIRFISPDISVAQYSGDSWDRLMERAEDSLHLIRKAASNVSEETKLLEMETHGAMIGKIGDNLLDWQMLFSVRFISGYLNNSTKTFDNITVIRSSDWRVRTEADIVQELATATEKNLPSFFIAANTKELARKKYSGNPLELKIFEVLLRIDTMYFYKFEQKESLFLANSITKEQHAITVHGYGILTQLAYEMTEEAFLQPDNYTTIIEAFMARLPEFIVASPKPLVDPNGMQELEVDDEEEGTDGQV
jgi:hypothetical protein